MLEDFVSLRMILIVVLVPVAVFLLVYLMRMAFGLLPRWFQDSRSPFTVIIPGELYLGTIEQVQDELTVPDSIEFPTIVCLDPPGVVFMRRLAGEVRKRSNGLLYGRVFPPESDGKKAAMVACLREFAPFLCAKTTPRPVCLCCPDGKSTSPALAVGLLLLRNKWDLETALGVVARCRPEIEIEEEYLDVLGQFAAHIHRATRLRGSRRLGDEDEDEDVDEEYSDDDDDLLLEGEEAGVDDDEKDDDEEEEMIETEDFD